MPEIVYAPTANVPEELAASLLEVFIANADDFFAVGKPLEIALDRAIAEVTEDAAAAQRDGLMTEPAVPADLAMELKPLATELGDADDEGDRVAALAAIVEAVLEKAGPPTPVDLVAAAEGVVIADTAAAIAGRGLAIGWTSRAGRGRVIGPHWKHSGSARTVVLMLQRDYPGAQALLKGVRHGAGTVR